MGGEGGVEFLNWAVLLNLPLHTTLFKDSPLANKVSSKLNSSTGSRIQGDTTKLKKSGRGIRISIVMADPGFPDGGANPIIFAVYFPKTA